MVVWWVLLCGTIEPFGVVLGGAQGRHSPHAAVYDRVTPREVDDGGGVQLSALRHHRGGVVPRVVRAAGHAVHPLQHSAHVAHLGGGGGEVRWTDEWTEFVQRRACRLTSLVMHSGWKALVPQLMISVLFTSRTLM